MASPHRTLLSSRTSAFKSGDSIVVPCGPKRGIRVGAAQITARAAVAGSSSASSSRMRTRDLSSQVKSVRSAMEEDEQLRVLMNGLRGSNIDDSDFAMDNVRMNLVEVVKSADDTEQLPLMYNPDLIAAYWDRRPVSVITRILQLLSIGGGFISKLLFDAATNNLKRNEVSRAIDLRNIMTSLGPAYIKLGQALSIRPDLLSPAAMNELQKLCDKVPSFDNKLAMAVIQEELGQPWYKVYAELTPEPIAAASLGQVYKGKLKTGELVAVKVQRPYVLETVTIDLYIIRRVGMMLRKFFPDTAKRADIVALLDEWAARFFEELDYVHEGQNATRFAEQMKVDLPQVVVPKTYAELTSRRVLTTEWLDGEKLSQSKANDVGSLVNVGVICYLKQLLDTGFFHADPHPGNLIRTPDGRLAILDFGLMSEVDDDIKYGMIEAISHLIHRDYEAIVKDFVTLDFIPEGTDLQPILPVLARVFDQALEGGGAKSINFQELAADLAQITFDYPFRIPPYFALIIRSISVLEGIALVGNPDFAIVDEAYPYIAQRLLTDNSPRLREALRYMVYGKTGVFDADRLIDLLMALEDFTVASKSARGDLDKQPAVRAAAASSATTLRPAYPALAAADASEAPSMSGRSSGGSSSSGGAGAFAYPELNTGFGSGNAGFGFPFPAPAAAMGFVGPPNNLLQQLLAASPLSQLLGVTGDTAAMDVASATYAPGTSGSAFANRLAASGSTSSTREALKFILSPEGMWFREFIMDELARSIDALSREQAYMLVHRLGLDKVMLPVPLPGARRATLPLAPEVSNEDRQVVENVAKIVSFLTRGKAASAAAPAAPAGAAPAVAGPSGSSSDVLLLGRSELLNELLPVLPTVATEVLPQLSQRLLSRIGARLVRELYV